jgi:hypothetical protein
VVTGWVLRRDPGVLFPPREPPSGHSAIPPLPPPAAMPPCGG